MGHRHAAVRLSRPLVLSSPNDLDRFLVDEFSDLYYDPSPLREHEKEAKAASGEDGEKPERLSMPPPEHMAADSPQLRRTHSSAGPMQFSPRHQAPYPQNIGFNNMARPPPGQFYGNGDHGVPSPMRMGGMGMPMGDMGGMGGMPMGGMGPMGPMGMGSPDVRRGLRRGVSMSDDGFGLGGMH